MHVTPAFKSSPHCAPSPNGSFVATLFPSKIQIRSVQSLETVSEVLLPPDVTGPASTLQWSPTSSRLLVALADQVHVFSALDDGFRATIRLPASGTSKPTLVQFGASDTEVCVCFQFGRTFTVFNLVSSKSVEISNPKFHHASSAPRGFAFRPGSRHLALMTRATGKDVVSIHHPVTRDVERSWHPDTIDAQGLVWTPDGRWLVIWESASQGRKVLFYTPDGHLFKVWSGPSGFLADEKDYDLGAGVKFCQSSPDARRIAIGDHTCNVYILDAGAVTEASRLRHPSVISPKDTIQIWQEQIGPGPSGPSTHAFVRAKQTVSAPTFQPSGSGTELEVGCASAAFDSSSSLLATKLEEAPSTIWIWDLVSSELRAVLIFHASISDFSWHPDMRELLMIRCEGDSYSGLLFVWDPLWEGPRTLDFGSHMPDSKIGGKTQSSWVTWPGQPAVLFFGNTRHYMIATPARSEETPAPWQDFQIGDRSLGKRKIESPSPRQGGGTDGLFPLNDELSCVDDTFSFKK
ncbi:WD40 domain-containing protein [Sodiomyces alkalinus F11]|uniref:WD40 domain-containing protein n=1 Tax=Sodiomyces alkalinus (strain CBS 110278 / VKM F-3762 / F11) TaxID=1314773 RepID=A0A3N2PMW8_SODAK|nr:WD40 domain-containing protein [Sodiomyces alkalinus F11]ROT35868.1 WD40 domain-containing protein [Sodiomyces alkalinus F11]